MYVKIIHILLLHVFEIIDNFVKKRCRDVIVWPMWFTQFTFVLVTAAIPVPFLC